MLGWVLAAIAAEPTLAQHVDLQGRHVPAQVLLRDLPLLGGSRLHRRRRRPERPEDSFRSSGASAAWLHEQSRHRAVGRRARVPCGAATCAATRPPKARIAYRGPNPPPHAAEAEARPHQRRGPRRAAVLRTIVHPYGDTPAGRRRRLLLADRARRREDARARASAAARATSTTSCTCTATPTCSASRRRVRAVLAAEVRPRRHRGPRRREHPRIAVRATRSSPSGRTCSDTSCRGRCHRSPSSGRARRVFAWLAGERRRAPLRRAEHGRTSTAAGRAPRAITSWRRGIPLETHPLRRREPPEGRDRLPRGGRTPGPRLVEPYSLRRTQDGNLVLFVVNDRGELRSYRVDRIAGVRPTAEPFRPSFLVEF